MPSIQLGKGIMLIDQSDWDWLKVQYRKPYVNGSGYARCNERGTGSTKSHAVQICGYAPFQKIEKTVQRQNTIQAVFVAFHLLSVMEIMRHTSESTERKSV